jgi:hypothetical protein
MFVATELEAEFDIAGRIVESGSGEGMCRVRY